MKTFNPFYDFATRSVLAPRVSHIYMYGYRFPVAEPNQQRVLDFDISCDEAARRYGTVTGINL